MTLESLLTKAEPQQFLLPALVTGLLASQGCATAVPYHEENQGGNTGASQEEGGAASFGGIGGNGGSEEVCLPNNSFICHEGDVYWQDSCGELGSMYQSCSEKEICENGLCLYDCSMVTPNSGCPEQNCAFYDSFADEICKWNINSGAPEVSNEKLYLEGNDIVEAKGLFTLASACNGDFIAQYKAELLDGSTQGSLKISHRNTDPNFSGITLTDYPTNNNKIILDCNGYEVMAGDFDLHAQKKLVVKKIANLLELYVDDVYITKVTCNETTDPTPAYAIVISAGSAVLPQAMKVDDITLYCSSN